MNISNDNHIGRIVRLIILEYEQYNDKHNYISANY